MGIGFAILGPSNLNVHGKIKKEANQESDLSFRDFTMPLKLFEQYDRIEYRNGEFKKVLKSRYSYEK
jgi:hypothetical protein